MPTLPSRLDPPHTTPKPNDGTTATKPSRIILGDRRPSSHQSMTALAKCCEG